MELSRDVNVALAAVYPWIGSPGVLDGLAASGARWIRVLNESGIDFQASFCDRDNRATRLIGRNLAINGLSANVIRSRFEELPLDDHFNAVDIDPFGSPASFAEHGLALTYPRGLLCMTATDTQALCGSSPTTAARRYDARVFMSPCYAEVGIRTLIGHTARRAGTFDCTVEPVLCHAVDHHYRVYLRKVKGARRSDSALKERMGWLRVGDMGEQTWVLRDRGERGDIGPLWIGPLTDPDVARKAAAWAERNMEERKRTIKLIRTLAEEAGAAGYHNINEISGILKRSPPPLETVLEGLRDMGHTASRTHFTPLGIKTDAPHRDLLDVISSRPCQ